MYVRSSNSGGMAALSAALAPTLRRLAVGPWPFGTEGCAEEWPQLCSLEDWGALAHDLGPVHLPRLERMAVFREGYAPAFPEGFDALGPSIPALRALELGRCVCGDGDCEIVGCAAPETVEVLAELRAAWPGLELRRFEKHDRTQA